ncbi:MAG: putative RDD family membrane protein YckC, partial [Mariniblastus sp.]
GVTFFEMTFGRLPRTMTGKSVAQWIKNHDELELDFPTLWPEQLPETWKTVLTKMLACDPAQRHQTFDELLNELNSIKPASKTDARFFPRMFAVGIDWAIALSLTVLFQIGMEMPAWKELHANFPIFPLAFHLVNFLPIVCFTILTYFWRQSIGRTLMHIRVVNQFGMRPTASTMAMRSLVRMQFPWVVIALELFRNELDVFPMVVLASIYMLSLMFLVVDLAFMVVFSKNRAIHDIIWKTRVVLDTTNAE